MSALATDCLPQGQAQELFEEFVSASTCRAALWSFNQLCDHLQLDRSAGAERPLFRPIRSRLNYWKANALWRKLERRASQQEYQCGRGASSTTTVRTGPPTRDEVRSICLLKPVSFLSLSLVGQCVVVGAGPCGLRTAVELGFLGFRVVLLEKRETFSRNNVLHLWPFVIHDLRGLGAKKFYGKFCAGAIDHISEPARLWWPVCVVVSLWHWWCVGDNSSLLQSPWCWIGHQPQLHAFPVCRYPAAATDPPEGGAADGGGGPHGGGVQEAAGATGEAAAATP